MQPPAVLCWIVSFVEAAIGLSCFPLSFSNLNHLLLGYYSKPWKALSSLFLLIILPWCERKPPNDDGASSDQLHQGAPCNGVDQPQDIQEMPPQEIETTQEDPVICALKNLNKKDLEVSQILRYHLITYINDKTDQIPERVMDDNFIKSKIPQQVLDLREEIVNRKKLKDNQLVIEYIRIRKQFLLTCKSQLKPKNSSISHHMSTIKQWIKQCNISLRIIIPNERVLCQELLGESSTISEQCFTLFCFQVKQDILRFIKDDMPDLMNSPEITLVFRTVKELILPRFRSLFPRDKYMIAEIVSILRTIGKGIRDYYFRDDDFVDEIERMPYSCEVHPITKRALFRLRTALSDKENIEPILEAYPNHKVKVWKGRSYISNYIYWNVKVLEACLEAMLYNNKYNDALWDEFIMGNVNYILRKADEFGFEVTMEDDWVKE